jgi:hypothetical protein
MNSNKHLGVISFVVSILFLYLPLIDYLITFVSHQIFDPFLFNDEFRKRYYFLLMVGNYPHLNLVLESISISFLLFSKSSVNKFIFYITLVVLLLLLLFDIFLYIFF